MYRYGGLGIQIPTETADIEFSTSTEITEQLTQLIFDQEMDLSKLNNEQLKATKARVYLEKEAALKEKSARISETLPEGQRKSFETAQEKGASSWLSALPIQSLGYALNKQEFRDAICLRYGWKVKNTPTHCVCGAMNSVDHALVCKTGGYVSMRHNALRDTEAMLMKEVAKDVQIEPGLLPVPAGALPIGANATDGARLDVAARGIYRQNERTFFDVRVTHPNADYNKDKTLEEIYNHHEDEKKRKYNERVIQIEKASFVPLVFTTSGGLSPECNKFNKKLAQMIAKKRNETYANVVKHVRTRLRFALLRSTLVALRGVRGGHIRAGGEDLQEVSFNLIPEGTSYEA